MGQAAAEERNASQNHIPVYNENIVSSTSFPFWETDFESDRQLFIGLKGGNTTRWYIHKPVGQVTSIGDPQHFDSTIPPAPAFPNQLHPPSPQDVNLKDKRTGEGDSQSFSSASDYLTLS